MDQKTQIYHSKIRKLEQVASNRIKPLLDNLGIEYKELNNKFIGPCPIHQGDNPYGWNLYKNEGESPLWRCFTHQCHEHGSRLVHLIKSIKNISFYSAINYLCYFNKVDFDNININLQFENESQFIRDNVYSSPIAFEIARYKIRNRMIIPSSYYLCRGYKATTMNKYDIGVFREPTEKFKDRAIIPIYNQDIQCVGFAGRSIFEKCFKCGEFHNPGEECKPFSKWTSNYNLKRNQCLYNYWYAKSHIEKTGVAIIVEGPGDVWRLEEAGVHNSVAIFGTHFDIKQLIMLCQIGAVSLVLLTDSDEAGLNSKKIIQESSSRYFNLYPMEIKAKDIGELSVSDIQKDVKPKLEGYR